jgi:hypothetical protein
MEAFLTIFGNVLGWYSQTTSSSSETGPDFERITGKNNFLDFKSSIIIE